MKYKLLVLDVDGTLLNNERQISKRNLSALLKVQQAGVRIVLASGRPTYGILHLAKALELGNYGGFVISYNGCQIIKAENGEIVFERRINPELIPYLEKKARKNSLFQKASNSHLTQIDIMYHPYTQFFVNLFNQFVSRHKQLMAQRRRNEPQIKRSVFDNSLLNIN